eukprot:2110565-Rhodomonas_salina.1
MQRCRIVLRGEVRQAAAMAGGKCVSAELRAERRLQRKICFCAFTAQLANTKKKKKKQEKEEKEKKNRRSPLRRWPAGGGPCSTASSVRPRALVPPARDSAPRA